MIRPYLELVKKSFQNNMVYRADCLAGIINTVLMIFVNISIWRAIYEEEEELGGVQFRILITYIVLAFVMQGLFVMNEYFIQGRVRSGLIASDLIKPMNFNAYVFSYNAGGLFFRLLVQMFPALLVAILMFKILPPFSFMNAVCFLLSATLGYLVLYSLNYIVWICAFWFFHIFSLVTIKDAFVSILSGALVPLWFMPDWLVRFIQYTPFGSIYYQPISIYLGQIPVNEMLETFVIQLFWIGLLYGIGKILWLSATKKLVIQGG